ncbi:MAG: NACHT domain-containing protein [Gammaproteobacteria bacterium]|nr:NACHT domain-containing protein [Gammaproteobacteria bacterium]MBY0544811.1 NACHT domain-containing protein [Gammaproteobacteria bacterium]
MFSAESTKTLLDYHVERYNIAPAPENFLILDKVFKQYQPQPTKTFLDINSILPLTRLRIDKPEVVGLIKQLLENLRQNAVSSTIESLPYFYGLLRAFQLADSQLYDADYYKASVEYTVAEAKRLPIVGLQSVALIFILLDRWRDTTESKARVSKKLADDILKLLDSAGKELARREISPLEDNAKTAFIISHTANLVQLMVKPVGSGFERAYYRYIHSTVTGVSVLGEQQLKLTSVIASFTYFAATSATLATPVGWIIAGAVLTGFVGYAGFYKGIIGWWESMQRDWQGYAVLNGDEASYLFCKDVLDTLTLLSQPEEASTWSEFFATLRVELLKRHYWKLHLVLAQFIGVMYIQWLKAQGFDEEGLLQQTKPWIELCVHLYTQKYHNKRQAAWILALATLKIQFPSLHPFIWQRLAEVESQFKKSIFERYRTTQLQLREEFDKTKTSKLEYLSDIPLVNQIQEEWLQKADALTLKPIRDYWNRSRQVTNALSWDQVKPYYITPRLRTENTDIMLKDCYQQLLTAVKSIEVSKHFTYLLFGEAGMGKSSAMQWLYDKLQQDYLENQHDIMQPIPILISLASLKQNGENFVKAWFVNLEIGYTLGQIEQLRKEYRFIFLLDGYDELIFCQGESQAYRTLVDTYLEQWTGCVLISCRTYLENKCNRFRAAKIYYLQEFDNFQKIRYLTSRTQTNSKLQKKLLGLQLQQPTVWKLLDNPLLAYMISDVCTSTGRYAGKSNSLEQLQQTLQRNEAITRYTIYEAFTDQWFVDEFERLVRTKDLNINLSGQYNDDWRNLLRQYAEKIAILMYEMKTIYISDEQLTIQEKELLQAVLVVNAHDVKSFVTRLRNACPLKAVGVKSYQFIHKSFQEFLVAQALLKALPLKTKYIQSTLCHPKTQEVLFENITLYDQADAEIFRSQLPKLIGNLWNQLEIRREVAVLDFLREAKPSQYRLLEVICKSKGELVNNIYKGNIQLMQVAGNALTLYNYCGYSVAGLNLDDTCVQNTDVSNGLFSQVSLQRVQWHDVIARHTQWQDANLTQARMIDVKFGEYAYYQGEQGENFVTCLVIVSNTSTQAFVGYTNGIIVCWDWKLQRCLQQWQAHKNKIISLAISKDSKLLVSSSIDGELRVWQVREQVARMYVLSSDFTCVALEGNRIVCGSDDKTVRVWKMENENIWQQHVLRGHMKGVTCVAVSGDRVVSGSSDNTVLVWQICREKTRLQRVLQGHAGTITCIVLEGDRIVSSSTDKTVRVWHVPSIELHKTASSSRDTRREMHPQHVLKGHAESITCVAICGERVASGSTDGELRVWQVSEQVAIELRMLRGHTKGISCVAFEGDHIVSGSEDKTVRVWQVSNKEECEQHMLQGHIKRVNCIALERERMISGSIDGELRMWQLSNEEAYQLCIFQGHTARVTCVVLEGERVVSGSRDKTVRVWRVSGTKVRHLCVLQGHTNWVTCVAISDECVISGSYDKTVRIWQMSGENVRQMYVLQGHTEWISCVAGCSKWVVSGSMGGELRVWQMSEQGIHLVHTLWEHKYEISCIILAGDRAVSASWDKVCVWDLARGVCQKVLPYSRELTDESKPCVLCFHPLCPEWLIVVFDNSHIMVWDIKSAHVIATQQWLACSVVAADLITGRLVLGFENGALLEIAVRPPHY